MLKQALKESQTTLQSFYDSSPFFMGVVELQGETAVPLYWNAAAADFFGVERPVTAPDRGSEYPRQSTSFGSRTTGKVRRRTARFASNMNTRRIAARAG